MSSVKESIFDLYRKIESSDIGRRIASGAIWSFLGTASAKFLVLVAGVFCARILGKTQYGELGMIRSTISLFVTVGSVGMGMTASKYIGQYRATDKQRVPNIYSLTSSVAILSGAIVSVLVFVFSESLAEKVLNATHLVSELRIGALMLFITVINGAQNGVLSGFEDFRSLSINTFISSVFESVFLVIGAYCWGVKGAILGYGLSFLILWLLNFRTIRLDFKEFAIPFVFDIRRTDLSILLNFSIPAACCSLLVVPVFWICKAMLANRCGFDEVAIYEVADQWKVIILFFPSAISQIVLPILSSMVKSEGVSEETKESYWKVLNINIFLNAGITLLLTICVAVFSRLIMHLYGEGFDDVWPLIIICISTVFTSASQVVGLAIASLNKMWVGLLFNLFWAIMTISLTYVFINLGLGATAVALAICSAYFVHTMVQLAYLKIIKKRQ